MKDIYNKVLDEISSDNRLDTGIFDVTNNAHLDIFREYLKKENISEEDAIIASNKLAESGKHPEKQAYNKNGLLVTFPSPEYKQRALARGTHFEQNPKKADINIFGAEQGQQPQSQSTPPETGTVPPTNPDQVQQSIQAQKPEIPDTAIVTPSAHISSSAPPVDNTPELDTRTAAEKTQDANVVQKMLALEYTLEEAKSFGFYSKDNISYYNQSGEFVGKCWYIDELGKQIIR